MYDNIFAGYLGPGGYHDDAKYPPECIGGATGYIDKKILTIDHMYQHATAREVYHSGIFDPEGILGNDQCSLLERNLFIVYKI